MAFEFFRRRQRLVIIIMVVLMVSFLIGFQGFEMILQRSQTGAAVGKASFGKLTRADLSSAAEDLQLLRTIGLDRPGAPFYTVDRFVQIVYGNPRGAALTYAILDREAQHTGIKAGQSDVDEFFGRLGRDYETVVSALPVGWTEKRLREAMIRWVRINKAFEANLVNVVPSEPEMRHVYRDVFEEIDLEVAAIPADKYIDQVGEVDEEEIRALFGEYRSVEPGKPTDKNPMAIGFKQPARVKISYLVIDREVIQRVAVPTEERARKHYNKFKERYVRPAEPATAPAIEPSNAQGVQMTFAEAEEQIRRELGPTIVNECMDDLATTIRTMLEDRAKKAGGPSVGDFDWVRRQLVAAADAVLKRELGNVDIELPLDAAAKALADKAKVSAIVFPVGRHGKLTIDPSVVVTVKAQAITLGEALDSVSRQILGKALATQPAADDVQEPTSQPAFGWAMLDRTLPNVLFAVGGPDGVDMLPVKVDSTDFASREQLKQDPVVGYAATASRKTLLDAAFSSRPIAGKAADAGALEIGEEGSRMQTIGGDYLLWRLADARAGYVPGDAELNDAKFRAAVVNTLKLQKAYGLALSRARELKEQAAEQGLEKAAAAGGFETLKTGPVTRKTLVNPRMELELSPELSQEQALARIIQTPPEQIVWSTVLHLDKPTPQQRRELVERLFELAPTNVEPPYPDTPRALDVIELPAKRQVAVVQRTGFRPAVESEYEQRKPAIAFALRQHRHWQALAGWFDLGNIEKRVGFQAAEVSEAPAEVED